MTEMKAGRKIAALMIVLGIGTPGCSTQQKITDIEPAQPPAGLVIAVAASAEAESLSRQVEQKMQRVLTSPLTEHLTRAQYRRCREAVTHYARREGLFTDSDTLSAPSSPFARDLVAQVIEATARKPEIDPQRYFLALSALSVKAMGAGLADKRTLQFTDAGLHVTDAERADGEQLLDDLLNTLSPPSGRKIAIASASHKHIRPKKLAHA